MKPGDLVRIRPQILPGHSRHYGRGRLVAIDGARVAVKPFGRHRRIEWVGVGDVRVWRGKQGA